MIYQLKGIGCLAQKARRLGAVNEEVNRYTIEALFTTVTNVDFDPERLVQWIQEGNRIRTMMTDIYRSAAKEAGRSINEEDWPASAVYEPKQTVAELVEEASAIQGISIPSGTQDKDIRSLQQLLIYGLKGMAAYAEHAYMLGEKEDDVFAFFHEALAAVNDTPLGVDELVKLNMRCGETNIRVMEMLDKGHTTRFGHPEPTSVSTGLTQGPAIIVTGHDLIDLETLLQQSRTFQ